MISLLSDRFGSGAVCDGLRGKPSKLLTPKRSWPRCRIRGFGSVFVEVERRDLRPGLAWQAAGFAAATKKVNPGRSWRNRPSGGGSAGGGRGGTPHNPHPPKL